MSCGSAHPVTADMDLPSPPNEDGAPSVAAADDSSSPAATATTIRPEFTPSSTWRKKPSQKGKPRFRLVKHPRSTTPKRPVAPRRKAAAGDGERPRPAVRRKLDLDGEPEPKPTKISNPPAVVRGSFRRATLMDNLRSVFAKLASTKEPPAPPPKKKINLLCFGRVQLMNNLRSLAKAHNLSAVVVTDQSPDDKAGNKSSSVAKPAKTKKPTWVDELVLEPYNGRKRAAAGDDEDPFRALVVHHELAGALVPRWTSVVLDRVRLRGLRLVKGITPAIEAVYGVLVKLEETCRGDDLHDVPESPELDEKRRVLEARVKRFMEQARRIIGDRKYSKWNGSVVTSVVGTFLTQNVTDQLSSNAFMNLAAEFSLSKNGSNVKQSSNVPLIENGCELGESECTEAVSPDERGKCCDKGIYIEELIAALRTGEVANWGKDRRMEALGNSFGESTAAKLIHDIPSMENTSHWNSLLKEAYDNGYRKEKPDETVDWEALLNSSFAKIAHCIKDRGSQYQMTFRILAFLIRIKRDHGSIDLEWLRYVPRAKAKRYLRSITGLGAKSVDCIRLLSLRHRAFPVDTNVARIVTRLGWVELEPLPDSQEFHLVTTYPVMADIQKYLEPLLCKIPANEVYELHCQMITFGKSICTKRRPNCGACPLTAECKYYQSLASRAFRALPGYSQQHEREQTEMGGRPSPSPERMNQYQIEMAQGTERHCNEPIIEFPPTPRREDPVAQSDEPCEDPVAQSDEPCEDPVAQSDEEYEYDSCDDIEEQGFHDFDIEDFASERNVIKDGFDGVIDLRSSKPTENAATWPAYGKEIIPIQPRVSSTPMIKKFCLRTEYTAYKIPDGHGILDKFYPRVPDDCNPYLLIIRSCPNEHIVTATILIPCRTANKNVFPLNGTYFQDNEVFADNSSSLSPLEIKRTQIDFFNMQCTVYFGRSIHSVTKGQTQEGIHHFYHGGYICNRGFNRTTRRSEPLCPKIHATNNVQGSGRKKSMTFQAQSPGEGNDKDAAAQSS